MTPRGRSKIVAGIKPLDIYKLYHKEFKKTPMDCSFKEFKDILDDTSIKMRNHLLEGKTIELGHRMGDMVINKHKQYLMSKTGEIRLSIDWKLSKEYKKRMYHLNSHSREFIYFVDWQTKKTKLINKTFYDFKPCRTFARMLAIEIKKGKDYIAS